MFSPLHLRFGAYFEESSVCGVARYNSKETSLPDALNLNNCRNPLHADQGKPDIVQSAFTNVSKSVQCLLSGVSITP